jgi:hypothetical protein
LRLALRAPGVFGLVAWSIRDSLLGVRHTGIATSSVAKWSACWRFGLRSVRHGVLLVRRAALSVCIIFHTLEGFDTIRLPRVGLARPHLGVAVGLDAAWQWLGGQRTVHGSMRWRIAFNG